MAHTRSVSLGAAFVAIVVAFAAGWLTRRWRNAENGLRLARARFPPDRHRPDHHRQDRRAGRDGQHADPGRATRH